MKGIIRCLELGWMISLIYSQVGYNHPELQWQTFETTHFYIHFTPETERTAREGAFVAESIYPYVTHVYNYEPVSKTHLIFLDTDDYSNGVTYYYDNKIEIWASPLNFELRGSHRWLQNVITHEFTHIVSLQKSFKFGKNIPGGYLQWIGYEKETRKDVLYGYPKTLVSYPIPGATIPPWLAEGIAQYMFKGAIFDFWDTHRDMILRDRVLNGRLLTLTEMNTFGKSGIGNESIYNAGFAFVRYLTYKYGESSLMKIISNFSNPMVFSINDAIEKAIGVPGIQAYKDFKKVLQERYDRLTTQIRKNEVIGKIIISKGTTNIHPIWAPDGERFAYLSNQDNDFFSQTDLFIYDFHTGKSEKITEDVISPPTWKSTNDVIYYSKRSKPDKYGSKWYDLYQYNFEKKKEERVTIGSRVFSPTILPGDSLIAYITIHDGTNNIVMINLNSEKSEQITNFNDGRQIFTLSFDPIQGWLLFDYVENHFRNTAFLSLKDTTFGNLIATTEWDERDIIPFLDEGYIFSNDKSGIFNLFLMNNQSGQQGYITNVLGGAFMPDVNQDGKILYALYQNEGYKIVLLDSIHFIEEEKVGYNPDYFEKFAFLPNPIINQDSTTADNYNDQFSPMFIMPKIMMDYESIKLGYYFYSSEILNRLNIFGGASLNKVKDLDLFLMFEFRKFYPTLFTEIYYITRNVSENSYFNVVYNLDYDLRFRLFQWDAGIKFPILESNEFKLYGTFQQYHEDIKERVERKFGKVGFDYYIGKHVGISWYTFVHKPSVDWDINPNNGYRVYLDGKYEYDKFFEGFEINKKYSTWQTVFTPYRFWRLYQESEIHIPIPKTGRWTTSLGIKSGWMSHTEVDSFFNFFGGGLPGMKGYPFYSLEGNRIFEGSVIIRIPLMRENHIPIGPIILQNIIIGFEGQYGDAWDGELETFHGKRSFGLQLRFSGFSFYNYPLGIAMEVHKGLDKFSSGKTVIGGDIRTYFTMLFGF